MDLTPFAPLALGLCLAAAAVADPAVPEKPLAAPGEAAKLADLEHAFWVCDYVATTEGIGSTPVAACRYATEELKRLKFGGSFREMLQWWRAHKVEEHRRIEESRR